MYINIYKLIENPALFGMARIEALNITKYLDRVIAKGIISLRYLDNLLEKLEKSLRNHLNMTLFLQYLAHRIINQHKMSADAKQVLLKLIQHEKFIFCDEEKRFTFWRDEGTGQTIFDAINSWDLQIEHAFDERFVELLQIDMPENSQALLGNKSNYTIKLNAEVTPTLVLVRDVELRERHSLVDHHADYVIRKIHNYLASVARSDWNWDKKKFRDYLSELQHALDDVVTYSIILQDLIYFSVHALTITSKSIANEIVDCLSREELFLFRPDLQHVVLWQDCKESLTLYSFLALHGDSDLFNRVYSRMIDVFSMDREKCLANLILQRDKHGNHALDQAIKGKNPTIVRTVLKDARNSLHEKDFIALLSKHVRNSHQENLYELMMLYYDFEVVKSFFDTMRNFGEVGRFMVLKILNEPNCFGHTLLNYALKNNNLELADYLRKMGARDASSLERKEGKHKYRFTSTFYGNARKRQRTSTSEHVHKGYSQRSTFG